MRRAMLLAALGLVAAAAPVRADERLELTRLERLLAEGRLHELASAEAGSAWGGYLRWMGRTWWRQGEGTFTPSAPPPLLARRIAWHAEPAGPYPVAADDPTPIATALITERIAREATGEVLDKAAGEAFLESIGHPATYNAVRHVFWRLDTVWGPYEPSEEERAGADHARERAAQNGTLAWIAVLGLVLACGLLGWLVRVPADADRSPDGTES